MGNPFIGCSPIHKIVWGNRSEDILPKDVVNMYRTLIIYWEKDEIDDYAEIRNVNDDEEILDTSDVFVLDIKNKHFDVKQVHTKFKEEHKYFIISSEYLTNEDIRFLVYILNYSDPALKILEM